MEEIILNRLFKEGLITKVELIKAINYMKNVNNKKLKSCV